VKKQIKKLQLNRDTLTVLERHQEKDLRNVEGAALPETYACTRQSKCYCLT
jgi:hypothetical protein